MKWVNDKEEIPEFGDVIYQYGTAYKCTNHVIAKVTFINGITQTLIIKYTSYVGSEQKVSVFYQQMISGASHPSDFSKWSMNHIDRKNIKRILWLKEY